MKKVVLAYSGGLDTNYCVKYLQEEAYEVVAVTVNTGGFSPEELSDIQSLATSAGCAEYRLIDAIADVYQTFGAYVIKGNILRGGVYPLVVGAERVIQAEKIVQVAREVGAEAVAHGSTGAGNDQVRFDVTFQTLAPELKIIAPIRELRLSREEEVAYLKERGMDLPADRKTYSINQGIFGVTIGGGETHDPWQEVPESAYVSTQSIEKAPDERTECTITFEGGLPVSLNGETLPGEEILARLNTIGGEHGFGRGVHVGDTILGIKGRIAFEAPGMLSLIKAHHELEKIILSKNQLEWKQMISQMYGSYLHEARWYDPLMRDWEAFIDSTQQSVTGEARLVFYKGHCTVSGVRSSSSVLSSGSRYGEGSSLWDGAEAAGFSKVYGIGSALSYRSQQR
ncbi:argininosuccinate synthase [bacterium]|nr:argininosuccinate synthase [bacterium]